MATKPARPALDAWLAKADAVLAEARGAALSPSSAAGPWDDHRTEEATTLAGLATQLDGLLSRLAFGPGRWALIAEDSVGRYVQVLAFEDGSLAAEVVSNNYLPTDQPRSKQDESTLRVLGWGQPGEGRPNWRVSWPTISPDIGEVSALLMSTLRGAFGLVETDELPLAMFSCPQRGGTPASRTAPADNADKVAAHQLPKTGDADRTRDKTRGAEA